MIIETVQEILHYFIAKKRRWLLPIVVFLLVLGVLIVVSANSVFAPFIYTLF